MIILAADLGQALGELLREVLTDRSSSSPDPWSPNQTPMRESSSRTTPGQSDGNRIFTSPSVLGIENNKPIQVVSENFKRLVLMDVNNFI